MRVVALEEHFVSESYSQYIPRDAGASAHRKTRDAHLGHDALKELHDIDASRLAAMDEAGIDFQVVSLFSPGAQGLNRDDSMRVSRETNDQLYAATKKHPSRFAGFATLPTIDPAEAARELERAVTKLGFKGALINGHTHGEYLDDRKYWPIFEAAVALDVPVYMHPRDPHPDVAKIYYKGYPEMASAGWGFAVETSVHFLKLVFGGVFDQFPTLKIILGHLGEGLPFGLDRMEDHTYYSCHHRGLKRTAAQYLRENLVVTTSGNFSIPAFMCTIQVLGIDNVMFSVDWPLETNKAAVDFLKHLPIAPQDLEKIAHANAERILKLGNN